MPYFFSLVKELKPSTTLWVMRLRLIRSFDVPAYNNKNEVASFEFIFQDKEGDRVHASARGHAMIFLKAKPVEGHLYALKDFIVLENRSKFKTTTHPYKINFLRKIKIEKIFDEKFPETIYNLKSFSQLEKDKENSQFSLFDVIGKIISCQLPPVATERGKRMEFILEDHVNNNIKCTLWDNYVDDLLPFVEADSEENIIVLIEFGRISIFGEQVRVCNSFNITKITVNGESRVFQNFNEGSANSGSIYAPLTTFESISAPKSFNSVPKEIEEALTDRVGLFKVQVRETDQNRNYVIYNVTRLTADERILSVYNDNYVQKKVKLLCHDEETGITGNMILNSSENSNEPFEEEHEELQEKK
ncbi:hypothetical protein OROMI_017159 [Orobanche minor]